ncbi:MAG TPA: hypothetical protein VFJ13_08110 [Paracoccaceae bacterium]|nr:hypothetical protein [Paracoccaceae bacterium]
MRFLAAVLAGCLAAAEAAAGAWTLAEGSGQIIMTTGRKIAPVGAFFSGLPDEDSNTAQLFVEYGVADRWTLGATLYADTSSIDPQDLEIRAGTHLRHHLWTRENGDVVSVQIGLAAPIERWIVGRELAASLPGSVPEAHLRALYGHGWQSGLGNSFVSAEAGFHWRGESAADELRLDVTAGHEAWKGVLGLIGVYAMLPAIGEDDPSLKLAPSIAWTLWPWLGPNDKKPFGEIDPNTIQLGLTWDALNPDEGLGVQISVWRSF